MPDTPAYVNIASDSMAVHFGGLTDSADRKVVAKHDLRMLHAAGIVLADDHAFELHTVLGCSAVANALRTQAKDDLIANSRMVFAVDAGRQMHPIRVKRQQILFDLFNIRMDQIALANKISCKKRARTLINIGRRAHLFDSPSRMMTIRLDMLSASS